MVESRYIRWLLVQRRQRMRLVCSWATVPYLAQRFLLLALPALLVQPVWGQTTTEFAAVEFMPTDTVSDDVLDAVGRAIGFIESLPSDRGPRVAVLYGDTTPRARDQAESAATHLATLRGPNGRHLQVSVYSISELMAASDALDAAYLMPGAVPHEAEGLTALFANRHIASISSDPMCLGLGCCVLLVRVEGRVEITLNTAVARRVGTRFSTVFTMMVKRV